MEQRKETKETNQQHIARKSNNCWQRLVGMCKKVGPLAKAKYRQVQLDARKRRFGAEYMNMVDRGASEAELRQCVVEARKELDFIQQDIQAFMAVAARINEKTSRKLVRRPGEPVDSELPYVETTVAISEEELDYVSVPPTVKPTAPIEDL